MNRQDAQKDKLAATNKEDGNVDKIAENTSTATAGAPTDSVTTASVTTASVEEKAVTTSTSDKSSRKEVNSVHKDMGQVIFLCYLRHPDIICILMPLFFISCFCFAVRFLILPLLCSLALYYLLLGVYEGLF